MIQCNLRPVAITIKFQIERLYWWNFMFCGDIHEILENSTLSSSSVNSNVLSNMKSVSKLWSPRL